MIKLTDEAKESIAAAMLACIMVVGGLFWLCWHVVIWIVKRLH